MKAGIQTGIRQIHVQDVAVPRLDADDVLIRVKACGICGTDMMFYEGRISVDFPFIPGHELSGEVVEVGSHVRFLRPGNRVSVDPFIACGTCTYCRMRLSSCYCQSYPLKDRAVGEPGGPMNGGFAEYVVAPESASYKLPDSVSFEAGALAEPLSCCVHALDESGFTAGESAVVIGDGPIGFFLIQLLRISGASCIIAAGHHDERLRRLDVLSGVKTINTKREEVLDIVAHETKGLGADVVFEASGNPEALEKSLNVVRRGGRIVAVGVYPIDVEIRLEPYVLHHKELKISGSFCNPGTFSRTIGFLASESINIELMITDVFPLDKIVDAYETQKKEPKRCKVIIRP